MTTDPSRLTKTQLIQSYWQYKLKAEYWEAQYRAAIKHDHAIIVNLQAENCKPHKEAHDGAAE